MRTPSYVVVLSRSYAVAGSGASCEPAGLPQDRAHQVPPLLGGRRGEALGQGQGSGGLVLLGQRSLLGAVRHIACCWRGAAASAAGPAEGTAGPGRAARTGTL